MKIATLILSVLLISCVAEIEEDEPIEIFEEEDSDVGYWDDEVSGRSNCNAAFWLYFENPTTGTITKILVPVECEMFWREQGDPPPMPGEQIINPGIDPEY